MTKNRGKIEKKLANNIENQRFRNLRLWHPFGERDVLFWWFGHRSDEFIVLAPHRMVV